jgi:hypothetical protein
MATSLLSDINSCRWTRHRRVAGVRLRAPVVIRGQFAHLGAETLDENPFVDPEGYRAFVARKERASPDTLAAQRGAKAPNPAR